MNSKKLNTLIGIATFVIVYGTGILIFQALSYGGNFFVQKKSKHGDTLYFFYGSCYSAFYSALDQN
jgi:hypothetical protein